MEMLRESPSEWSGAVESKFFDSSSDVFLPADIAPRIVDIPEQRGILATGEGAKRA